MNLVQQANFLEDVPKDQLVSMSQDPNAQFPPFLVLSEIQRRTTNEKNYQAMVNQPTTTVAEEVVSNFAQPTGLQGGAPQTTPLSTNISAGLSGAPTAPMQMAASGGITGYANKGQTEYKAGQDPFLTANSKITSKQYSEILNKIAQNRIEERGQIAGRMSNMGDRAFSIMGGSGNNIRLNPNEEKMFVELANQIINKKASGGVTGYATGNMTALPAGSAPMIGAGIGMDALGANIDLERLAEIRNQVGDQAFKFMFGEKFGDEFMDYVSVIPAGGLALKGLTKAPGLISSGYKGLKNYFKKAKTKDTPLSDVKIKGGGSQPGGVLRETIEEAGPGRKFIQPIIDNPLTSALVATPVLGLINQAMGDSEASDIVSDTKLNTFTQEQYDAAIAQAKKDEKTRLEGLAGAAKTMQSENKGDYRDLVRLGAGIMSAKNIGEIGTAVTGVLDAQDKRGLVGLQGQLTKAQILKLESDIENQPLEQLQSTASLLYKGISDGSLDREKNEPILEEYLKQIQKLQNVVVASTGSEILNKRKIA